MRKFFQRAIYFLLIASSVIGLDQAVKWRVSHDLLLGQSWDSLPWLSDFLLITHSYNTGAAFGIFPWASDVILAIAGITIVAFTLSFARLPENARFSRIGVALIVGGALSNVIDRVFIGHVIDYFHVRIFDFSNISNFADHSVTVGVALLLLEQWRFERHELKRKRDLIDRVESWALPFAHGASAPISDDHRWPLNGDTGVASETDDETAPAGEWLAYPASDPLSVSYDESSPTDILSS